MQQNYAEIKALGAEIIAVSADDLTGAAALVRQFNLPFPVLYSSGLPDVPEKYGVWELHEPNLAAPAVFLIDRTGRLVWSEISTNYRDRTSTDEIVQRLVALRSG